MNKKAVVLLIDDIISSGLVYAHSVYTHNFGGDKSTSFLAKVAEIKTEVGFIANMFQIHKIKTINMR